MTDGNDQHKAKLSDGSTLTYRRPGRRTIAEAQKARQKEINEAFDSMSARLNEIQKARIVNSPQKEDADLSLPERRDAEFQRVHNDTLLFLAATAWKSAGGRDVAGDPISMEAIEDLHEDLVAEAARVLFDAYNDRVDAHRKN